MPRRPKALLFDVFGTVVDWRTSVASQLQDFFHPRGITRDWIQFILDWRALYQPAMQAVRSGAREFVILDVLHQENLLTLLQTYEIPNLTNEETAHLTRVWHRLTPWPDCVPGLSRLKRDFPLITLSNGNVALMLNLARFGGLPWDAILGAEFTRSYKPDPQTYLGSAAALGLAPADCMMVAAHNQDLHAASALGFATAFVARPTEYGPGQTVDLSPEDDWDYVTNSMTGLADLLGC
jgi:2-haloacid dehalogenase